LQGTIAQAATLAIFGNDILRGYQREDFWPAATVFKFFAGAFRNASGKLSSADPLAGTYHSDLAPTPIMPLEAKQLLASAQAAWVFGGMGSWNDLGFDGNDQQEYTALSDELFLLLNQAIGATVNTTSGAAGP
jgi:hypothetical protein